jgi:hypothetical protein
MIIPEVAIDMIDLIFAISIFTMPSPTRKPVSKDTFLFLIDRDTNLQPSFDNDRDKDFLPLQ